MTGSKEDFTDIREAESSEYWPTQEEAQEVEILRTLSAFEVPLTKPRIKMLAENAVESIVEHGNPLQAAEAIKGMEEFIDGMRKDKRFIDAVREESGKYGRTGFKSPSGAKIEPFEAGTKYDYESCNDPVWNELARQKKEREDFLKTLKEPLRMIDEQGEVHLITPPVKTCTSSYKVSIPVA